MNNLMNRPVLIVNASYEPINIAVARVALKLLVKGKADVEVGLKFEVYQGIEMPSVVRLRRFRKVPHVRVQPHRRNIYLRDGYRCQYCYQQFSPKELTLDHVIPKAQGGPDTWENMVACCTPCNRKKADQTPEQAGMELLQEPRRLTIHTNRHMMQLMGNQDQEWRKYLYC